MTVQYLNERTWAKWPSYSGSHAFSPHISVEGARNKKIQKKETASTLYFYIFLTSAFANCKFEAYSSFSLEILHLYTEQGMKGMR